MKSISPALKLHLQETVTTLCTIWKITRMDGVSFHFTDHDRDIAFEGDTYKSSKGYNRTAIQNDSSLSVDNLDIMGIFDSDEITEEDIRAGKFDYAEIRISVVNWADLTQGNLKVRRGRLGECISSPLGWFKAEMRGMTQNLSMTIGEVYQAECRADLGDSRCKVPIRPALMLRDTVYAVGDVRLFATDTAGKDTLDDGYYEASAYENVYYQCTTAGATGVSAPTFDTDPGDTTTEAGRKATSIMTFTGNPSNGQTCTIGGKVYTCQTTLTDVDGNFLRGANTAATQANLLAAMTLGAGSGTLYAASTTAHTTVDFVQGSGTTINLSAKTAGSAGNSIGTTETMSSVAFTGSTLLGGIDGCVWTAVTSWTRHATILGSPGRDTFALDIEEPRAVADWFNGGGLFFESGENEGWGIEIRDWALQVSATGNITFTGQPSNGQSCVIGGKTYTFQTSLTDVDGNVLRGADAAACAANLAAAINLGAGSGTLYAASMTVNPAVTAVNVSGACNFTAKVPGTLGNAVTITEALTNATRSGATLTGGSGGLTVFLDAPYPVNAGDKVRLYPGCDKRDATCAGRFDNILNFRGEPFVPGTDSITNYPDSK